MATSQKQRDAVVRENFLKTVVDALTNYGSDLEVLRTGSGSIAIPVLDEEQNERYIEITVKVPTGERGGDPYDGYAMAEEYQRKIMAKEEKAKADAEAKAKKIARDAEIRAAKKAAKEAEQG